MDRFRICWLAALSLAFAIPRAGWSQTPIPSSVSLVEKRLQKPAATKSANYKLYALGELSDDPSVGQWITNTIPLVIEPESWGGEGAHTLSYCAPSKILLVYHTAEVHAQVDAFLKKMKNALPHETEKATAKMVKPAPYPDLVQAKYAVPNVIQASDPVPLNPYPVPKQAQQPKHLFHFIIRYEGEGIIDSNVVNFFKYFGDNGDSESKVPRTLPADPLCGTPPPAPVTNPALERPKSPLPVPSPLTNLSTTATNSNAGISGTVVVPTKKVPIPAP